jgi:murein peptide amidase A
MNFINLKSGVSVEGDEILAFRSEEKAQTYCYLMAGVHGDEVEGAYVLKNIFEWLKENELDEDIKAKFIIIPTLNPDGLRVASRTNSHGIDLNRNFPTKNWTSEAREERYNPGTQPLSEPENIFLDKMFKKFPPHLILTFHSWKPFINYNGDCKEVAEFLAKHNKYPIHADIEGHPTPGSLGEYATETYNTPVLTFECPVITDNLSLKDIWQENKEALLNLLQSDLIKK